MPVVLLNACGRVILTTRIPFPSRACMEVIVGHRCSRRSPFGLPIFPCSAVEKDREFALMLNPPPFRARYKRRSH